MRKSSKHNRTNAGKTGSHSLNVCETLFPGGKRRMEGYKNRSVPGALNKSCKQGWGLKTAADWGLEKALDFYSYLSVNVQIFPSNNCKTFCKQLCQDLTNTKFIFWAVPANNLLNIDLGLTHYCFLTPKEAILYHFTFPKFTYIISQGFFQCAVVI